MAHSGGLGSQPIEDAQRKVMRDIGKLLDGAINRGGKKEWGFILMVFPLGEKPGRCNYISSANRDDVVTMLKEQLRYFEGAPDDIKGTA